MRKEIKDLPKEMQVAYKKVADRPDSSTPEEVLNFISGTAENYANQFMVNEIVNYADEKLLDLDLDEKLEDPYIYNTFAIHVAAKVTSLVDLDTKESKSLEFYDNNEKITRLKAKDFSKFGNLKDIEPLERADIFAKHYGIQDTQEYLELSAWEKRLFADKVYTREKTAAEKK